MICDECEIQSMSCLNNLYVQINFTIIFVFVDVVICCGCRRRRRRRHRRQYRRCLFYLHFILQQLSCYSIAVVIVFVVVVSGV